MEETETMEDLQWSEMLLYAWCETGAPLIQCDLAQSLYDKANQPILGKTVGKPTEHHILGQAC